MADARLARLRRRTRSLPREPGVYQWLDDEGRVIYVGKAIDLRARASSYLVGGKSVRVEELMRHARDLDFIVVRNNKEALLLEQTLIKRLKPRYNAHLTDDKSYPYIKLTAPPYPRLLKVHGRHDDGATYFGPFPDGYGAYKVMGALNDLFPLRRCKTLPRVKCLYYDIGKCIAPCIDACTDDEYDALVDEVKALLRGRSNDILRRLQVQIEEAAAAHRFEEAARLRDQLQGLRGVLEQQHMMADRIEDRDIAAIETRQAKAVVVILHQREGKIIGQSPFIIDAPPEGEAGETLAAFLTGYYADRVVPRFVAADLAGAAAGELEIDLRLLADRAVTVEAPKRGGKRRWLEVAGTNARLRLEEELVRAASRGRGAVEALQKALGLASEPRIIEGFDISHHSGAHTRAAMVRFVDGEPDKSGYRTFLIRGLDGDIDDFASMNESVGRRIRGLLERGEALPGLMVIDGGKGQLSAARAAVAAHGVTVPMVGLAKREEEVFLVDRLHPIKLPRSHPGLQLLQRVRDEAHRFGIRQVRRKAGRAVTKSPLDDVPGVGPKRRQQLVQAFGGLDGLRAASAADLQVVPGITPELAGRIAAALATDAAPVGGDAK